MNSTNDTKGVNGSMQAVAGPSRPNPTAPSALASSTAPTNNYFMSSNNEGNAFASGSSGPSLPPVTLPAGGGAIRGMGENIAMNAVQGTASFSIPINLSKSRNGAEPQMTLQYGSGGGGSVWGIGWNLSGVINVSRQTRLGLPKYEDGEREDVFVISGLEDLVPVYLRDNKGELVHKTGSGSGDGDYMLDEKLHDGFVVRQYRPRIEGLYSRVERWTDQLDPDDIHWRIISPANEITILGRDENSQIRSMNGGETKIFSWLCCEWYDCFGNARMYEYKKENSDGVDLGQCNEMNRTEDSRATQRYLKRVKYGNRTPIAERSIRSSAAAKLASTDWMFEVVFDYGEHDWNNPGPQEIEGQLWACRRDPFSSFISSFEVRTYRLCRRVLMYHHFPEELGRQDYLVNALEIKYQEGPAITYLKSAQQSAFVLCSENDPPPAESDKGSPYFVKRLPPLALEYTQLPTEEDVQRMTLQELDDDAGLENVPEGVQGSYQWLDLLCEGLNGISFTNSASEWYYKRNLSAANEYTTTQGKADPFAAGPMDIRKPKFGPQERVAVRPSLCPPNGSPQFLDLEGDGRLNLAVTEGPMLGFYRYTADAAVTPSSTQDVWEPFRPFDSWPAINMNDPNLRLIDVTGDGKADILISQDDVFVWYESLGEGGFSTLSGTIPLGLDEDESPRILFSDPTESIHLADFNGDGLVDIVRVRNGEICYWPNMGYGRFGARVVMDNAPHFDYTDAFSFQRLILGDIDGSGTTDLIYFYDKGAVIYYNLAGNAWSDPLHIGSLVPKFDLMTTVAAVDLFGSGTMCLVWSSSNPAEAQGRSMRYVDLSGGQKPHLLSKVITNMGSETRFIYRPSTAYYLDDLAAGTPWATRLPYPQQCVDRVITYDRVGKVSLTQRYSYHHGYFDAIEREFRGFGMVEQWDTEQFEWLNGPDDAVNQARETHTPPAHTKSWFHTGAFMDHEKLSRTYAHEYFGAPGPSSPDYDTAFEKFFNKQLRDQLPVNAAELSLNDLREASRAFKGALLRSEIYGDDGSKKSGVPYEIADVGNSVRMFQPHGKINQHAVFQTFVREKLTHHLERNADDPRIEHSLTLDVDDFGNELESATVCYGRQASSDPQSNLEDRDIQRQRELKIAYSQNNYTNPVLETDNYRVPHPSRSRNWEVSKLAPSDASLGRFTPAEFSQVNGMMEIAFDQTPDSAVPHKRLIERVETQYRRNDLSCLLDIDQQESLGLPGVSYRLCITSSMASIFRRDGENLLSDIATLLPIHGGYVDREDNGNWWIPSSQSFYDPRLTAGPAEELLMARAHFFTPQRVQDEFGANAFMRLDPHYLSYVEIEDQIGNVMSGQMDYRTLQLHAVTDPNGNRTQVIRDALGLAVGLAVMGKEGELLGDTLEGFQPNLTNEDINAYFLNPVDSAATFLAGATSRFIYDVDSYQRNGANSPNWASSILRETHHYDPLPSTSDVAIEELRTLVSVSYIDGYHREIQVKKQAEPSSSVPTIPRWRGTGWNVFNNKGSLVQQFEPFFDETHTFQFNRRQGVSSTFVYDSMSRAIGIILPNTTWSKEVKGAWDISEWDVNDTVTKNLFDDEDLGNEIQFLSKDGLETPWLGARIEGQKGLQEQIAATKTMAHANTPTVTYLDCLARPILVVKDNGLEGKISNRAAYDIQGNVLQIRDGLDRVVKTNRHSMCGQTILTESGDSGSRWELVDVHGNIMRQWDSRGNRFRNEYDVLRRPTNTYSQRAGKEALVNILAYGEEQPESQARNLRGKVFREFDQAGVLTHREWDFKGNQLLEERQFTQEYKTVISWVDTSVVVLERDSYQTQRTFDALNRVITIKSPDQSVVKNDFNKGGLLQSVVANLKGDQQATSIVASSEYDAYARVILHTGGNNTTTTNTFDPLTQRLTNRTVVRQQGSSRTTVQNLSYTYDPVGNVMYIQNDAEQTVFFRNGAVEPNSEYTYDAIYRLTEATGREHVGQTKGAPSGPGISSSLVALSSATAAPEDSSAMVRYAEQYVYDAADCITTIRHQLADLKFSGWTRRFNYEMDQECRKSNRLVSTTTGNLTENYTYDANGNMKSMPHLSKIRWDCGNCLRSTSRQILADGIPETTWYVYDGTGERVRKVTERQTATTETSSATKIQERLIINGFEIYRQYSGDGKTITRQCETLDVTGIEVRVAIVEDWAGGSEGSFRLIRFQLQDHLQSINIELDEKGMLLTYEEYMPFGSTSYRSPLSKAPKRYRFSSKERDTETDFYYFGLRYYMPWLARWANPDPIGTAGGLNVFEYVLSNPIRYIDPQGTSYTHTGPQVKKQRVGSSASSAASTISGSLTSSAASSVSSSTSNLLSSSLASSPASMSSSSAAPRKSERLKRALSSSSSGDLQGAFYDRKIPSKFKYKDTNLKGFIEGVAQYAQGKKNVLGRIGAFEDLQEKFHYYQLASDDNNQDEVLNVQRQLTMKQFSKQLLPGMSGFVTAPIDGAEEWHMIGVHLQEDANGNRALFVHNPDYIMSSTGPITGIDGIRTLQAITGASVFMQGPGNDSSGYFRGDKQQCMSRSIQWVDRVTKCGLSGPWDSIPPERLPAHPEASYWTSISRNLRAGKFPANYT